MHILWVGVLRPIMYTQGHTIKHTLLVAGRIFNANDFYMCYDWK